MFTPGQVYNRRTDLHAVYGGQQQGGISTPAGAPVIFIFTGDTGEQYGYRDEFRPDGTFWYTGEGQTGNMQMVRGNEAIRDHQANDKTIHLFEQADRGHVRYVGEAAYLNDHREDRPDLDGNLRQAIVFELEVSPPTDFSKTGQPVATPGDRVVLKKLWSRPLDEVRRRAVQQSAATASEQVRRVITYERSEAVRVYVLRRADGICEACRQPAPFTARAGRRPYLEPHHIRRLADGGPDDPRWVAGICPNCHREAHYGVEGDALNARLAGYLGQIENSNTTG